MLVLLYLVGHPNVVPIQGPNESSTQPPLVLAVGGADISTGSMGAEWRKAMRKLIYILLQVDANGLGNGRLEDRPGLSLHR